MSHRVTVVGLGPGAPEPLTPGTLAVVRAGAQVYLRTDRHPAVPVLRALGVGYQSLAGLYDSTGDGAAADDLAAHRLVAAAAVGEVVYAVPEHPLAHPGLLLRLLAAAGAQGVDVRLAPGDDRRHGLQPRGHDPISAAAPTQHPAAESVPHPAAAWADRPANGQAGAMARLLEVMATLRGPAGCPWDQEQTHASLRPYLLEEAYEAVEAIDRGDPAHLCEELGDVLLQVVFHAQLAQEQGRFTMADIIAGLVNKLIRRHPHVFGVVQVKDADDVVRNWEAIKATEAGVTPDPAAETSLLRGVSRALPALTRALKLQKRAARVGFDWPDVDGALAKVREELEEVQQALAIHGDQDRATMAAEELGDLLFAVVNVGRFLQVDPETALTATCAKFIHRFEYMERTAKRQGRGLGEMNLAEMDMLWEQAKGKK